MTAGTPLLSPAGKLLATTFALPLAARAIPVYPMADRRRLIDQLTLALGSFYVHLNRKKAIYGFDPVRALALLALKIDTMSDAEFHENLVELLGRCVTGTSSSSAAPLMVPLQWCPLPSRPAGKTAFSSLS